MRKNNIAILIVSFNRRDLVLKNIEAVSLLVYKHFDVILFDNGSVDNTVAAVKEQYPHVTIFQSDENLGGAGGFASGMKEAYQLGYEYIWCLDDDGYPAPEALGILMEEISLSKNPGIYGTLILPYGGNNEKAHFWPIHGIFDKEKKRHIQFSEETKKEILTSKRAFETASVALLGMMVPRNVIDRIGFPETNLFISNDDVEYCLRAWVNDIPVTLVQQAVLFHPANNVVSVNLGFKKIEIMVMAPWKLYYYVRNIIYVAKKYCAVNVYIKLVIASFITVFFTVLKTKESKWKALKYGLLGLCHGFISKIGKFNFK